MFVRADPALSQVHCDKVSAFSVLLIAQSAAGNKSYSMEFAYSRLKIRAIAGYTKLNLGQLPSIAESIPRFYHYTILYIDKGAFFDRQVSLLHSKKLFLG